MEQAHEAEPPPPQHPSATSISAATTSPREARRCCSQCSTRLPEGMEATPRSSVAGLR